MDLNNNFSLWGGVYAVSAAVIAFGNSRAFDLLTAIKLSALLFIGILLVFITGAVIGKMATDNIEKKWLAWAKFIAAMVCMFLVFWYIGGKLK